MAQKSRPNLIIEIEDKPYSRADFLECLANYSAQLYRMKELSTKFNKVQQELKI